MGLIIGVDDFGKIMEQQLNFIDKSLFIKEIFDNKDIEAVVITRPRRFGKTLNMSMLHHFLAPVVNFIETKGMFDGLKIAQAGSEYMNHQGQYPVISISFKSMSYNTYAQTWATFKEVMSRLYGEHDHLLSSTVLRTDEKAGFERILRKEASEAELTSSLLNLSNYLHRHYQVKPWLLIDEYDTPIQSGYLHNYYDEIIQAMRGLFGNALKGNSHIHRAVITGILRVSKESLFSDVNNLKVFSVLSAEYAEHFGFTEKEVDSALKKAGLDDLSSQIKTWYNGYCIGDQQIYNPWSIANCINGKGLLIPYWVNSSGNDLVKDTMAAASAAIKEKFELILTGQAVNAVISENMVFGDLTTDGNALWSLLLFSGYLTAIQTELIDAGVQCLLRSPNYEVTLLYRNVIRNWFTGPLQEEEKYRAFLNHLTEGRLDDFLEIFKNFLLGSTSFLDYGSEPEKFYHGLVLGLILSLSDTHVVQSNKESGFGRYDVLIIPKDLSKLGLILEFKVAKPNIALEETAQQALNQINERQYATELRNKGVQKILKMGLAFRGKEVEMASSIV